MVGQGLQWVAFDLPSSQSRDAAVGRPGVVLVADTMAGRPGGRLAGAEYALRPRLLGHLSHRSQNETPVGVLRRGWPEAMVRSGGFWLRVAISISPRNPTTGQVSTCVVTASALTSRPLNQQG